MIFQHKISQWVILVLLFSGAIFSQLYGASISGVVLDAETGDVIEGATVAALGYESTSGDSLYFRTQTNANGFYAFDSLVPGRYFVLAEAENYQHQSQGPFELAPNEVIGEVNFELQPENGGGPAHLFGFVFDSQSQDPVHPAFIHLFGFTANGDSLIFVAETHPDGSYEIPGIVPGIYTVFVEAAGYETRIIDDISIEPGDNHFTFYLAPINFPEFGTIRGEVFFDSSGAPVVDAMLEFQSPLDSAFAPWYAYTNADGHYEMHLPAGDYFVICRVAVGPNLPAFYEEFYDNTQDPSEAILVTVPPNGVTDGINFGIPDDVGGGNTAHLYGFVYEANPDPIGILNPVHPAVVELFLQESTTGDSAFFRVVNNDDGSYEFPHIPAGIYHIICRAEGFEPVEFPEFFIHPGGNYLDFFLTPVIPGPKGFITGNVFFDETDAFVPVAGAILEFISPDGVSRFPVRSNNTGHYEAELPVGDYIVSCTVVEHFPHIPPFIYREYYDDAQSITDATIVPVEANQVTGNIDFGIPDFNPPNIAIITGQVTSEDGLPLADALVTVRPHLGFPNDSLYFATFTNDSGFYELTITTHLLPFNVFIASAEKEGYRIEFWEEKPSIHLADPIFAGGDSVIAGINFTLEPDIDPPNSISGTVASLSGDVLNVFVVASHIQSGRIEFTFSDPNGHYRLDGLEAGSYILLFAADGHIPEFYDDALIWEDATPVPAFGEVSGIDALLRPIVTDSNGGVVAGTVTDVNGQALPGVLMSIKNANGEVIGYDFSDGQGGYQISGVAGGSLTVQASKISYQSEANDVQFNGGTASTLMVNFDLQQAIVSVDPKNPGTVLPTNFGLAQNFPNPFNPSTTIRFSLPEAHHTRLTIYNLLGQEVYELVNRAMPAGQHEFTWNGTNRSGQKVVSGIYLYRLESGTVSLTRKMLLSK